MANIPGTTIVQPTVSTDPNVQAGKNVISTSQGTPLYDNGTSTLATTAANPPSSANPISVSGMTGNQTPINPSQPAQTGIPDVSNLYSPTPLNLTGGEQQASDLTKQIEALNNQLTGKSAYQQGLYQQQGFAVDANGNPTNQTLVDLQNQLKGLTTQAQQIPLQIQNAYVGSNATREGIQTQTNIQLRQNAIQALQVSSLVSAQQGMLGLAKAQIDQAVTAKYGPLEAEQKALMANLDLILKDPETTNAEKNAAQAQQAAQQQKADQIARDKQNYTDTQNEILKYAGVADAATLADMQKATTPTQVSQIAAQHGVNLPIAGRYKDVTKTLTDAFGNQYQEVRVLDTTTGQYVNSGGKNASQLNEQGNNEGISVGNTPIQGGAPISQASNQNGVSFDQYGLLANTDFNPKAGGQQGMVDGLAQNYIDNYLKNGTVPTASTLGRNMKPAAFAQVRDRADNLYFQATGSHLPNPEVIKGYQTQLIGNNKLLNNLNVQEGTIGQNAQLLLQNLNANNLNQNAQPINNFIDAVRNTLGDPNVAQFLAQNATVQNELGSLLALKNAQGTTVNDKLTAAGIISAKDSNAQIASKVKILLQEATNAQDAVKTANADLYKQIDPLLQDPNNPARQTEQVNQILSKQGIDYNDLITKMQDAQAQYPDTQPAIEIATGKPVFASSQEIKSGKYLPL